MDTIILLKEIVKAVDDKMGEDIKVINVSNKTIFGEYYVICSASSSRRLNAVKESVIESVEKLGLNIHHKEGISGSEWMLVDAYDVIVHIFTKEERERIKLEEIFKDEPSIDVLALLDK